MIRQLTAIIEREGNTYVALCPEVDIASQGDSIESAKENLREALELFFETVDPFEVGQRLHAEVMSRKSRSRLVKLKVLSGRAVCAILSRHGFTKVRQRGSHIVMQKVETGSTMTGYMGSDTIIALLSRASDAS